MDYFSLLDLQREPFSNSPDPDFFFESGRHASGLRRLELAIRLKRGVSVVIGEVGTGKSTLCRRLLRTLSSDRAMDTHLVLDPAFDSPREFLLRLAGMFAPSDEHTSRSENALKNLIQESLFERGVHQNTTTVLVVDEGQKISPGCLELLRELLNFETNSEKLLQIVIFAQQEFLPTMAAMPNFKDRVHQFITLGPLSLRETAALIRYRLTLAASGPGPAALFSIPALIAVHRYSGGFPRRIIHLCHKSLLAMIIAGKPGVTFKIVRSCAIQGDIIRAASRRSSTLSLKTAGLLAALFFLGVAPALTPRPAPVSGTALRGQVRWPAPAQEVTDAEPSPQAPPVFSADTLGTATIRSGDTLWGLTGTIYGTRDPSLCNQNMLAVIASNPAMSPKGLLTRNQKITFPVLRHRMATTDLFGVQHHCESDINRILSRMRPLHRPGSSRLLLFSTPETRLRYAIVSPPLHLTRKSAAAAAARLGDGTTVLHLPARKTTIYSTWAFPALARPTASTTPGGSHEHP